MQHIKGFWLISVIALLLALTAPLTAHAADQISVNFGSTIRPLTHAGSGIIHSFSATAPADSVVLPLKLQLVRSEPGSGSGGPFNTYNRAAAMGAAYVSEISNEWGFGGALPGDNGNWTAWETMCRDYATQAKAQNKNVLFELWNEPDNSGFWPDGTGRKAQYLEMWRRGYNAIKAVNPNAKLVGPTFNEYLGPGFMTVPEFLSWSKTNNVVPDVVAWHNFTSNIDADVAHLKSHAPAGVNISHLQINEMGVASEMTQPGAWPRYFNQVEKNGIESAARSCWVGCFNGSLDELLTSSSQPRSVWWAYERYGKMDGLSVATTSGAVLDAVASQKDGIAYALIGKRAANSGNQQVLFDNLDDIKLLLQGGKVHVLAERIANSGTSSSSGPTVSINADYTTSNGQLTLLLPNFGTSDAYAITLTQVLPGDYNGNGVVDAADYGAWRKVGGDLPAYQVWRSRFGQTLAAGLGADSSTVPEPQLTLWGLAVMLVLRRGSRKCS